MTPHEVHLVAYDVIEAALAESNLDEALTPMREELEVLSRDDLLRVAMAVTAETTLALPRAE